MSKNLTVIGSVEITVSPIQVFMKISPKPLSIKKTLRKVVDLQSAKKIGWYELKRLKKKHNLGRV